MSQANEGVPFPIVGIGASAGGLAAFEAFFSGMPGNVDPGMAFVLVQHLAPDHKSMLREIIQRFTRMHVYEVEDGMQVHPNCAYIIPPNRDMAFLNGTLQLLDPTAPRGHRMAIDFFFQSLAQDQREHAIAIVLAGTGNDGTAGVRAIKSEGGMVMVQQPDTTEFNGMPHSAIATGLVDYTLPPAEMPAQLIRYVEHQFGKLTKSGKSAGIKNDNALKKIFLLLRAQTNHDFSHYKPNTINRRIDRRLAVNQIESIDDYVKYLQQTPEEVIALFNDLLIGVTSFFRDTKAFKALEQNIIPNLIENKTEGVPIRIWSVACSSGEEAYSLAILIRECMEQKKKDHAVQIFATDIDNQAIATARSGLYSANIANDISPERLARFFTFEETENAYRIRKDLRDMLVFSEQDVIKDPPFSKLDLISCRNLLIYLDAELQRVLIPLFHFALKPGGILFLGSSEGIGGFEELFSVIDRDAKIYQRKDDFQGRPAVGRLQDPAPRFDITQAVVAGKVASPIKLRLREMTEQTLLQKVAPPSVLINEQGDILYLHGRTGMFLELVPGVAGVNNVLKMARDGLRPGLAAALHKAIETKQITRCSGLNVKTNDHYSPMNLTVLPVMTGNVASSAVFLYLVTMEDIPQIDQELTKQITDQLGADAGANAEARITALKQELRIKDEYIQTTQEELETSTEELKSSNEEMQSVNEELQSTNEELETSKEELQSVNEELATVNSELQTKVIDLSRANNDMNNLLAGTGIGTIFVDHQLNILRFTPAASAIINLIVSDIGRPVGHLVSNLIDYHALVADTQAVLNTLIPKELEVKTVNGKWYTMRIQPYRTLDNIIEGAVISFVDISETVTIRDSLRQANEAAKLAMMVSHSRDAVIVQNLDDQILAWNPAARQLYGWTEEQALAMKASERIPLPLRDDEFKRILRLCDANLLDSTVTERLASDGTVRTVQLIANPILDESGKICAVATTERLYQA